MPKVLLAEDDVSLADAVKDLLALDGFTVDSVIDGDQAEEYLKSFKYELLILDWELPFVSGVELCRRYRLRGGLAPVLMLTGKASVEEKETGLDAGCDDYLTKPFHPRELRARIRALMRRPPQVFGQSVRVRDIEFDSVQRSVSKNGSLVKMTALELSLLEFLIRHKGEVFSIDDLIRGVWDAESDISNDAIYAAIKRLRRKLDTPGQSSIITNVHGLGYKLEP